MKHPQIGELIRSLRHELGLTQQQLSVELGVITAIVGSEAQGRGGSISIDAETLEIRDGGQILAASLGDGEGGNINLNVSDRIEISGSDPRLSQRLQAEVITRRISNGEVRFDRFLTEEEGREQFSDRFVGIGDESQISGIFANTAENSTSNGGSITVGKKVEPVSNVFLADEGKIEVSSEGAGTGRSVEFFIGDLLQLSNDSLISARSSTGSGENITINAEDGFLVALFGQNNKSGNDIIANAPAGRGGNITIKTYLMPVVKLMES
ncbi:hypothetical protein [Myxosarcina sp. GI1(2024)]